MGFLNNSIRIFQCFQLTNFSFLDPTQLTKALSLTRFTSTQTISNSETAIQKLMDGVTKYFSALKDRAFWHMVTYSKWDQADIDSTSHEYIMTVPAIWSDCARDRTLRCALNAGLGVRGNMESIKLVTEPEAAAMFTISEVKIDFRESLSRVIELIRE